ncbi:PKD domain-containing protein, partial [bacterium AH-315-M05]|nr:PKD domain-containing protein [bacterium AH-315-M05]
MKKLLYIFLIISRMCGIWGGSSLAQITVLQSDMPVIGDTIPRAIDTLTTETGGGGGINQTWDFSSAIPHIQQNTAIINPAATPYAADFPTSNMAMTNDGIGFVYFNLNNANMFFKGIAGDLLDNGIIIVAPLNPDLTLSQFPVDYGNTLSDDYGFDVTTDGSVIDTLLDSVRLKRVGTVVDTVDGWGTTITPVGCYNSLRIKRLDYRLDSIWTKLPPLFPTPWPPSPWIFISATRDTVLSYSWLAKETRLALAELSFDSLGNPNRLTYSLMPPVRVAQFTHMDAGGGTINFTDQSTNTPTSWLWDFGDGNTSTSQNPNHPYTVDSTYFVCLTVTYPCESVTYCDSVVVSVTIGINEIAGDQEIKLFPNPASDQVQLVFSRGFNN